LGLSVPARPALTAPLHRPGTVLLARQTFGGGSITGLRSTGGGGVVSPPRRVMSGRRCPHGWVGHREGGSAGYELIRAGAYAHGESPGWNSLACDSYVVLVVLPLRLCPTPANCRPPHNHPGANDPGRSTRCASYRSRTASDSPGEIHSKMPRDLELLAAPGVGLPRVEVRRGRRGRRGRMASETVSGWRSRRGAGRETGALTG
jgi:hypothetical protein